MFNKYKKVGKMTEKQNRICVKVACKNDQFLKFKLQILKDYSISLKR